MTIEEKFGRIVNETAWHYIDTCPDLEEVTPADCDSFKERQLADAYDKMALLYQHGVAVVNRDSLARLQRLAEKRVQKELSKNRRYDDPMPREEVLLLLGLKEGDLDD